MAKSIINPNPNKLSPGLNQSPSGVTIAGLTKEYKTLYEMQNDPQQAVFSLVIDATADPTVTKGWALYRTFTTNDGHYRKVMSEDIINICDNINWTIIKGRPGTLDPDNLYGAETIDEAVAQRHTHLNITIIDEFKLINSKYTLGETGLGWVDVTTHIEYQIITNKEFDSFVTSFNIWKEDVNAQLLSLSTNKADKVDLDALTERVTAAESTIVIHGNSINTIKSYIPTNVSATNQLVDNSTFTSTIGEVNNRINGVTNRVDILEVRAGTADNRLYIDESNINSNTNSISAINEKIMTGATANNQLTTKSYVDDAITTSSSHFRGAWETYTAVPTDGSLYPDGKPTLNDYMIVLSEDNPTYPSRVGECWRYKYTGNWDEKGKDGWIPEYRINEKPFTQDQWNAINSGITAGTIIDIYDNLSVHSQSISEIGGTIGQINNRLDDIESDIEVHAGSITYLQENKQDNITCTNGVTITNSVISTVFPVDNNTFNNGGIALGDTNKAEYAGSVAFGSHNTTSLANQLVVGKYNVLDNTKLFIVGNGTSDTTTKNIFTIKTDGTVNAKGAFIDGNNNSSYTIASDLSTAKSDITELKSDVDTLEVRAGTADNRLDDIESDIEVHAGSITYLQENKQDKLIEGTNITIAEDGKTISSFDTPDKLKFEFTSSTFGTGYTVQDALERLMWDAPSLTNLSYIATYIQNGETKTTTGNNLTFEVGVTVTRQYFTWKRNRLMTSQTISNINSETRTLTGDVSDFDYTLNIPYNPTTTTSYSNTLRAYCYNREGTEQTSTSANFNIYFKLARYYGASEKEELTSADSATICGWSDKKLVGSCDDVKTTTPLYVNAPNKYVYVVVPTTYVMNGTTYKVGFKTFDLPSSGWIEKQVDVTNSNGAIIPCTIFRLPDIQTGNVKLEIVYNKIEN